MAVFESRYRPNMEVNILRNIKALSVPHTQQVGEAKELVRDAIAAGIFNDLVRIEISKNAH